VLRNMLLLRVVIMRAGDHPQTVWSMLDEALGDAPTTTLSWLHTARYWCGVAPRPPEEFEQDRQRAIKTPFGVLCLGGATTPHLLVYPDARTEKRAGAYLKSLAAQLEWYPVQARFRLQRYTDYAANAARNQQRALEQVTRSAQFWSVPQDEHRLRSLNPLQVDLDMLESTYASVLSDLTATRGAAQEVRALMSEYRLQLMQSGLWDIAPSVWEAQVAGLAGVQAQIEDDVQHIDSTLRRLELLIQMLQTRVSLLQSERERVLIYLVALLGLAVVAVLVADTSLTRMGMRLLALAAVVAGVGFAWQRWLRSRVP
jgi:hypothetical protein